MPIMMMSEMPFPMPRSVICSPSHMTKIVPAVIVMIVMSLKKRPGFGTTPAAMFSRKNAMPIAWMIERATVPYRVYCVIFFRPSSPSFASFSKYGITACRSWMMIDALMYGMMPSAKIVTRLKLPPAKRS